MSFSSTYKWIVNYLVNVFISVDQLANVVFINGYPDETISSRSYRWSLKVEESKWWIVPMKIIDTLFFWDKVTIEGIVVRHCQKSYLSEQARAHSPVDTRPDDFDPVDYIGKDE